MKNKFYTDCNSTKCIYLTDDEFATQYFEGVRKTRVLSPEEQRGLIYTSRHACKEEADRAKTVLIESNQRFIASIAKHVGKKENFSDLVSEGNIGLLKAIENYNLSFNQTFITYAQFWIRKYMMDYIVTVEPTVKPKNANKVNAYVDKAVNEFFLTNGRMPSPEELQDFLKERGIVFSKTDDLRQITVSYIDEFDNDDEEKYNAGLSNIYNAQTSTNNVEEMIENNHIRDWVKNIFDMLDEDEITVLKLLYGFNGEVESIERVAGLTFKTEKEVKDIKDKAIKKIKKKLLKYGQKENFIQ